MPDRQPPAEPALAAATISRAVQAFQAGRPEEAISLSGTLLRADPGDAAAAWVWGQVMLTQGRSAEALGPLQATARLTADPAIEMLLGRALVNLGRADEAEVVLRQAIARSPGFEMAFLELVDQLNKAHRLSEALVIAEQGLEAFPTSHAIRLALGYVLMRRNDRAGARAQFSQVRDEAPERHDAMVALAEVLVLDGEHREAARLYRAVLDQRPEHSTARMSLARCMLEIGERTEAEALLRAAVRDDPDAARVAITVLATTAHGRLFLRPSAAQRFL
jgi:predicted Zn-dependent protease